MENKTRLPVLRLHALGWTVNVTTVHPDAWAGILRAPLRRGTFTCGRTSAAKYIKFFWIQSFIWMPLWENEFNLVTIIHQNERHANHLDQIKSLPPFFFYFTHNLPKTETWFFIKSHCLAETKPALGLFFFSERYRHNWSARPCLRQRKEEPGGGVELHDGAP